ncbi:MAG: hypothetical protein OWQ50_06515 [Acidianus infernus]|nr:hypothetical protein [Acidianus infernus]
MEYNKDLDLEFLEDLQNLFRRDEVILRELHKLINEVKLQIMTQDVMSMINIKS